MTRNQPTLLICSLTSPTVAAMRADMEAAAARGAQAVECRLDFLKDPPDAEALRRLLTRPPVPLIVTCRPVRQGGRHQGDESRRMALLRQAAEFPSVTVDVELDAPRAKWPDPARVLLSHHDFDRLPADLDAIIRQMDASPAAANKTAFAAGAPEDAFRAFDILRTCRKPTIALAMNEPGLMSRILARKFGAMGTFAALSRGSESAPGQLTLEEMRKLYRWDSIGPATAVYGVIGCPVAHSMSPAIHNAAFAETGLDAVYVPLRIEPGAEHFNRFMDELLRRPWMDWRGLSVTIPHKENALAYVGPQNCDELARRIGAVNTITLTPGAAGQATALRGDNTDYAAAIDALCHAMGISRPDLAGRAVAVLGAGGAARAIVAALAHYHALVTIHNRTPARARQLADEFGCRAAALDDSTRPDAEIIINCTPIGMHPKIDDTPLKAIPSSARVVFDTIYNPVQTRLLSQAADAGCRIVSGLDMFVNQAAAQFETWTHRPAPRDIMRQVVIEKLAAS